MVTQSNSRRLADRDGSAVKNAGGNGGKHTPEAVKKSEKASYTLVCEQCGKSFISYGKQETENTAAANVTSGTDFSRGGSGRCSFRVIR